MEEDKKYRLLEDRFIMYKGRKLYRIRALKTLKTVSGSISKGALGGYIEGYRNLSQEGECWVFNDAKVYDNARVTNHAKIRGRAKIYGNAVIKDSALIFDRAEIFGNARIEDFAVVKMDARIYDNAVIRSEARVGSESEIYGNVLVLGDFYIHRSQYCGNARVKEL